MTDLLRLLLDVAPFGAGFLLGYLLRRALKATGPLCPCGHPNALHDPQGKHCLAEVKRRHYDDDGDRNGHEYVPCACRRYMGPELLADVWAGPGTYTPEALSRDVLREEPQGG